MEIFTKATGKMEKPTATESSLTQMVACMKANGSMINNTVKEQNLGISKKLNIPESLSMAKRQDKADLNLKEDTMKVNSKMENLTVKAYITFLILERFMRVISKKIIWMGMDLWFGQMILDMKENSKWER